MNTVDKQLPMNHWITYGYMDIEEGKKDVKTDEKVEHEMQVEIWENEGGK